MSSLPVTPFHIPIANILAKLNGKISLSLPAIIVGSMVPDLEIAFIPFLTGGTQDRLVLHSIIGGLTFGTVISIALTVLLYTPVTSAIFPINKSQVKAKCTFSVAVIFSCFIGCLSHVLLDVCNHAYNPIFWPFQSATTSPIVPLLGGGLIASLIMHGLMAVLFVSLFFNKREKIW